MPTMARSRLHRTCFEKSEKPMAALLKKETVVMILLMMSDERRRRVWCSFAQFYLILIDRL